MDVSFKNPNLKANQTTDWNKECLSRIEQSLIPIENSKWGRLLCTWHERKPEGVILHHTYTALVNRETLDLYLDCRPRKIYAKCLAHLFGRPIHILCKTLFHLSLLGVAYEIHQFIEGEQTRKEAITHSFKSLADIVRTPAYGIAMMIVNLAGLILGAILPRSLYTTRELLGKLEESLNWGTKRTVTTLAPCFQPLSLRPFSHELPTLHLEDTIYYSTHPVDVKLSNFARRAICLRRRKYNCFDQLKGTLESNRVYISKAIEMNGFKFNQLPSEFFSSHVPPLLKGAGSQNFLVSAGV